MMIPHLAHQLKMSHLMVQTIVRHVISILRNSTGIPHQVVTVMGTTFLDHILAVKQLAITKAFRTTTPPPTIATILQAMAAEEDTVVEINMVALRNQHTQSLRIYDGPRQTRTPREHMSEPKIAPGQNGFSGTRLELSKAPFST